jgi:glycosyltransferase involved in cell wall biosynthesis
VNHNAAQVTWTPAAIGGEYAPPVSAIGVAGGQHMSLTRHDQSHVSGSSVSTARSRRLAHAASSSSVQRAAHASSGILSIVVPAKNESQSLPQLVEEIVRAFRPLQSRAPEDAHQLDEFEIIVIDDGSTDSTPVVLHQLARTHPELRPVRLATNVGQSAATAAGFRASRGYWVAVLDADLQNHPSDLATLWDALPGYDAALGWRKERHDVWTKRVISRCANRVRNWVLGQSIRDTGCSVRIFPREVALRLPWFHGVHRFFGPLLLREGCQIVQVPVSHRPRPHGTSHYNLWNRSLKVVIDLLGVAWLMRRPLRYEVDVQAEARSADSMIAAQPVAQEV